MTAEMLFLSVSLIFALAVIVGANIWALQDPPETELQQALSKGIEDLLAEADRVHESGRQTPPAGPLTTTALDVRTALPGAVKHRHSGNGSRPDVSSGAAEGPTNQSSASTLTTPAPVAGSSGLGDGHGSGGATSGGSRPRFSSGLDRSRRRRRWWRRLLVMAHLTTAAVHGR